MENWNKLQSSFAGINFTQSAKGLTKGFTSSVQATRERLGQVAPDDITELPQEYKNLEARVDALRNAHLALLKVTKVYETGSYDYPIQIQESLNQFSSSIGQGFSSFAAANLKNTSFAKSPAPPRPAQPKTLPHAISRAAHDAADCLGDTQGDNKLQKGLAMYANAWEKIAEARLEHDGAIVEEFLMPWQATLSSSISVTMKARQAVSISRLELDAAKQALKGASASKLEQARLEVENCEDDLVQKTEVAITMMKALLDNPEPIKHLNGLLKAQLAYHTAAAETLSAIQPDIEDFSVEAEGEYRKSRDH